MPLILGTNSIKDTGYDVANSLRFNPGSSDTLSRTLSTPTNNKKFTFSFWFKKCENGREQHIVNGGASSSQFYFNSSDQLYFYDQTAGGTYKTTQVFRDVSAWYHIVVAEDTTQGTASSRIRIYVNGSEITDFAIETDPTQNNSSAYNTAATHTIGTYAVSPSGYYLNGYLAEFVFIDGQQLTPTSFGEFDSDSPTIWKPKDVSGLTFGTNGFYLDFQNASSLGADVSGNSNNFTVNNLTSVDQSTDTCTNNFATWNILMKNSNINFEDGNLHIRPQANSIDFQAASTLAFDSGKWYCEFKYLENDDHQLYGISTTNGASEDLRNLHFPGQNSHSVAQYGRDGQIYENNSATSYGSAYTNNDIIMLAVDSDNSKIYFGLNGTWQNSGNPATGTNGYSYNSSNLSGFKYIVAGNGTVGYDNTNANFGSPAFSISSGNSDGNGYGNFEYSVPSGYFSLCTKNLAEYG